MKNVKSTDVLCKRLFLSIKNLETMLDDEESIKLIGVYESAESFDKRSELRRLGRSLQQYISKSQALTYVGLVGHFSSGKSSTINTLLGLWNTKAERLVGLHPTDKAVTLITHSKNYESLLGLFNRGELQVGSTLIDNKLLENYVIVDTPGSGDPAVLKEMTLDILPICDHFIYFFSAASSLDETDIPILLKAHKDLPFIPIKFIITRANEFTKKKKSPISENNFNTESARQFIAELISRISNAIPGKAAAEENILLIDNLFSYNTDMLPKFILDAFKYPSTIHRGLHIHKIKYYISNIRSIRNFFMLFAEKKIEAIGSRVLIAKLHLKKYQEAVLLANNHLSENWKKKADKLVHVKNETFEWIGRLVSQSDIQSMINMQSFASAIEQIRKDFEFWSNNKANTMVRILKERLSHDATDQIRKVLISVNNSKADNLLNFLYNIKFSNSQKYEMPTIELPLSCRDSLIKLDAIIAAELKDMVVNLSNSLLKISNSFRKREFLEKVENVIFESQELVAEMIDNFFKSAETYKTTILATNIPELGENNSIPKKINILKAMQITEERKLAIKAKTIEMMFQDMDESFRRFKTISNKVLEKTLHFSSVCKRMIDFARNSTDHRPISKYILSLEKETEHSDFEKIINEVRHKSNERLIMVFQELQSRINRVVNEKQDEIREHISRLQRQRLKRFTGAISIGLALGGFAFLLYYLSNFRIDQNFLDTIISAVLTVVVTTSISLGIARLFDKTEIEMENIRFDYLEQMKAEVISIISEIKIGEYSFVNAYFSEFKNKISKMWENILEKLIHEYIEKSYKSFFKKNIEIYRKFETLKQLNLKATSDLLDSCFRYYHDSKNSFGILQATADEIKEEEILPSFNLLDQTHSKLCELSLTLKNFEIG